MKKKLLQILMVSALTIFVGLTGRAQPGVVYTGAMRELTDEIIDAQVPTASQSGGVVSRTTEEQIVLQIYELTNFYRVEAGLQPLMYDAKLAAAAGVRAAELPVKWSHTRPNGSEWYTVDPDVMYGENLASYYKTAQGAMNGWLNSPSHAANIYYKKFRTIGVALYTDENGTYWIAQEFGY